jgi:5-hydroxyisourate hydrolase
MSGITTHVLDTASGRPAAGVPVSLERQRESGWQVVGNGVTDTDGRLRTLLTTPPEAGTYRITFNTGAYFPTGFFPSVTITFDVTEGEEHYHVPLLLSPYSYSTYRGS